VHIIQGGVMSQRPGISCSNAQHANTHMAAEPIIQCSWQRPF
jgi:hypothetical protein